MWCDDRNERFGREKRVQDWLTAEKKLYDEQGSQLGNHECVENTKMILWSN